MAPIKLLSFIMLLAVVRLSSSQQDEALCYAAAEGNTQAVIQLLAEGADVNALNDFPIRWAAYKGHLETVKVLMDAGADTCAAFLFAKRKKQDAVAEYLLSECNACDFNGKQVFFIYE